MSKSTIFRGAGVAIVTPMNADGSVNFEKYRELIDWQIDNGTDAIITCGTTGESSTLTTEEHVEVIKAAVEQTAGRVPVIAGTGSNDTAFGIELSVEARELGWEGSGLDDYAYGMCIGGDRFGNYEGLLPDVPGRKWTECDIDTLHRDSRGAKRIVFSNDGLIYYTDDHYESFELLYGEP